MQVRVEHDLVVIGEHAIVWCICNECRTCGKQRCALREKRMRLVSRKAEDEGVFRLPITFSEAYRIGETQGVTVGFGWRRVQAMPPELSNVRGDLFAGIRVFVQESDSNGQRAELLTDHERGKPTQSCRIVPSIDLQPRGV